MTPIRRCAAAALLAVAGCTPHPPDSLTLTPVSYADLPGWQADHPAALLGNLVRDCAVLARMPLDAPLGGSGEAATLGGTAGQWMPACAQAQHLHTRSDGRARAFFEAAFRAYQVADDFRPDPLFTGYYEPELSGDTSPSALCATPLLGVPPDLVQTTLPAATADAAPRRVFGRRVGRQLERYWSRSAIEDGALDRQGLALLWLADPVAAFFMQIQGSGRVVLPDGTIVRVGYAGQNGQPFVDVGHLLRLRGALPPDRLSMQDVRQWLYDHPVERQAVMDANPSYVFFREEQALRPDQGPLGALGVPLSPGRSLAVDPHFIPLGAPVWVDTRDPTDGSRLQRLLLAQDVGGAIRGPARGDIFFGWGAQAEAHAGRMWGHGAEFVLLPRPATPMDEIATRPTPLELAGLPGGAAPR